MCLIKADKSFFIDKFKNVPIYIQKMDAKTLLRFLAWFMGAVVIAIAIYGVLTATW